MARVSKPAPTDERAIRAAVEALGRIGLHEDATIRFRRESGGRWIQGTACALEADGSVGLLDARGRRRSIPVDDIEVATQGPRGGQRWTPLRTIVTTDEQLGLF